ncbi:MAG TPA: DUF6701 domain-containing protein [Burkholderiales bacterium]|nr:DUF6701 domain-containing protein [Burkholderiales bacterium]
MTRVNQRIVAGAWIALLFAMLLPHAVDAQIIFHGASSAAGPGAGTITFRAATSAVSGNIVFRAASNSGTPTSVAPVFRAVASGTAATGVLTLTVARPANTVENDVMVAAIGVSASAPTITPPTGWTLVRKTDNTAANANSLAVYYKVATASESANYTWSFSASTGSVGGIQSFYNVDTSSPIDVENGQTTPSALGHAAPAITTTTANAMLVGHYTYSSSGLWAPQNPPGPPVAMTESFDVRNPAAAGATGQSLEGTRTLQAAAGLSATYSSNASANADFGNTHMLALRPQATNDIDLPTPAATVSGDVMIAAIGFQPSALTIAPPAGWTSIRRTANAAGTANTLETFQRIAVAGEPAVHRFVFSAAATAAVGGIQSFAGVDTTTPVDVENGRTTASAVTHATPSVTTTVAGTMIVTAHTFSSSRTWTPPAGMIESADRANLTVPNAAGQSIELNRVEQGPIGATGVKTATASGNADTGNTHILALRPATIVVTPSDFNAFETATVAGAIAGAIYTKLVSTNFSLDVVAILSGAQHGAFTDAAQVDLVTGSTGGANCPGTPATIAGTTQSVNLAGGRGTTGNFNVASAYRDVRVRIRYPVAAPTVTSCSTDNFSIRPAVFTVTSTNATQTNTSGTPAIKTGANFNLTAASVAGYDGTPSIDNTKVVGTPTAGTIGGSFGAAPVATGTATGASFFYSEVGNFGLNLNAVYDSNFTIVDQPNDCTADFSNTLVGGKYGCSFGSTAVAQTLGVSGFGRFIPDNFNVIFNTPQFGTACGTFTYVGRTFTYTTAPAIIVTARNGTNNGLTNATTNNYAGAYMKLSNAAGTSLNQTPYDTQAGRYSRFDALGGGATPALDTTGLPVTTGDPTIGAFINGVGTLTFASGTGLVFTRTIPSAPFDADIALALNAIDTDGVAYAGNPAAFGAATSGNGMAFSSGKAMRFGRLLLQNAFGSELQTLPLPMQTQFFQNPANGFVRNVNDNCTSIATITLTNNLAPPVTGANPTKSVKGATSTTATFGIVSGGDAGLTFSAPGSGGDGYVDVTIDPGVVPAHLQFDWDGVDQGGDGNLYDDNPQARATFGIYRGSPRHIYLRERY